MKKNRRWNAIGEWVDAADPGAVRREHAARVALAALTTWLVMRLAIGWLSAQSMPSVGIFAVTVCFISALVVVDPQRRQRQVTLLLGLAMFALALLLATLLSDTGWAYPLILLPLIFASFAARRWGMRPGELVLLLTMGLYFAEGVRVTWGTLPWCFLAATAGIAALWLWQFVILPYNPERSLRRSVRSFYNRAASMVDHIDGGFEPAAVEDEVWKRDLHRQLQQVKLSRRVIEGQFPGACAPGGWSESQISQLQLALFTAEQGLTQMVEGAENASQMLAIPEEIRMTLVRSIRSLRAALLAGDAQSMQLLAQEGSQLRDRVREYAGAVADDQTVAEDAPLADWVASALRLVAGSHQVARSIASVRAIVAEDGPSLQPAAEAPTASAVKRAGAGLPQLVRVLGGLNLHPTTVLGIQAVLATGLAMLVARLLNLDHSNWVFWTAFVVIAGSTGESLRKMMLRVVGTVGGATVGVALALLTPDNLIFVVIVATVCIFLTIFFAPVSYPQMVFWLNIGFVMVYTLLGANEFDLLFARPSTTMLGALVAALVVVYVFPIRMSDRFKVAAARFLCAVDGYVATFVTTMTAGGGEQALTAGQAQVAAAYAVVEQTLPAVVFENNPLLQAESPLTQQATKLAALDAEVTRLAHAAAEHGTQVDSPGAAEFMHSLQALIHNNVQMIIPLLNGVSANAAKAAPEQKVEASQSVRSWALAEGRLGGKFQADGEGQARGQSGGGLALIRIHGIIARIAAELGAPAAAMEMVDAE